MADTHASDGAIHLPFYMTPPGETDVLYVVVVVFVVFLILGIGVFYFKLHALPEQMAHKGDRTHMQIVAILALLALFTHNNLFWIAALLLAAIEFPEYQKYFASISDSLERIANRDDPAPIPGNEAARAAQASVETEAPADPVREG